MSQIKDILTKIRNVLRNKYFKFSFAAIIYILWVIWLGIFWFLLGLIIIFDIYITKKVNWSFWKKRNQKNNAFIEWLDALIFAVIAVTLINIFLFQNYKIPTMSMEKTLLRGDHLFVSKVTYGPRIPNTPISFPFTQHTLPLTEKTKSFVEWVKWDYKRLAGLKEIKNHDIVVFNFPTGDTVVVQNQAQSYYSILRNYVKSFKMRDEQRGNPIRSDATYYQMARKYVRDNYDIVVRPVDKRDNYIKRCVAVAGDTLEMRHGYVYINGQKEQSPEDLQFRYIITTNGTRINPKILERMGIYQEDVSTINSSTYVIPLTQENYNKMKEFSNVISVEKVERPEGDYADYIFPHHPNYPWNEDNFGPLYIPEKGRTIDIDVNNLPLYHRIIETYERNKVEVKDSTIYINGEEADSYTFKMGYYFMIGDNRHDSADSRFWGFVPDDHIVGSPVFIWLSIDKTKNFLNKIRWDRLFISAKH